MLGNPLTDYSPAPPRILMRDGKWLVPEDQRPALDVPLTIRADPNCSVYRRVGYEFRKPKARAPQRLAASIGGGGCAHRDWQRYGRCRNGDQRLRCSGCGKTRLARPRVRKFGMYLSELKQGFLAAAFADGWGSGKAAELAGVAAMTARKFRRLCGVAAICPCGDKAGHRGWCRCRLQHSPRRQEFLRQRWGKLVQVESEATDGKAR